MFLETLAPTGAIAIVLASFIIVLTLFYRGLAMLSPKGTNLETILVRGVLKKDTFAKVELTGNRTFERVQFKGFLQASDSKNNLPWEMNGMAVLTEEDGTSYVIRTKDIRMITLEQTT